jgi:uncharacterized protein involved in exopolysaccharide biosynthesis
MGTLSKGYDSIKKDADSFKETQSMLINSLKDEIELLRSKSIPSSSSSAQSICDIEELKAIKLNLTLVSEERDKVSTEFEKATWSFSNEISQLKQTHENEINLLFNERGSLESEVHSLNDRLSYEIASKSALEENLATIEAESNRLKVFDI